MEDGSGWEGGREDVRGPQCVVEAAGWGSERSGEEVSRLHSPKRPKAMHSALAHPSNPSTAPSFVSDVREVATSGWMHWGCRRKESRTSTSGRSPGQRATVAVGTSHDRPNTRKSTWFKRVLSSFLRLPLSFPSYHHLPITDLSFSP